MTNTTRLAGRGASLSRSASASFPMHERVRKGRKTAAKTAVAKVSQPNGGALYASGVPGNEGGSGRPPSAIREVLRGDYEARLPRLRNLADGVTELRIRQKCPECGYMPPKKQQRIRDVFVTADTSLRAMDHMAKIGLGVAHGIDIDEVRWRVRQTLDIVRRRLSSEEAEAIIAELRICWKANVPWQRRQHARTG